MNMEKTTNDVPKRKAGGESLIKEMSGETSSGLPRDVDADDAVVDTRRRERLAKEWNAVALRIEFHDSLRKYSISGAYQALMIGKKIASPFLAEMKQDFFDFLDECELRGMERLTARHIEFLNRLRADVEAENFKAPTFEVAQLAQFGDYVGEVEGRKQMEKLEGNLPAIKKEILLNVFWGCLRREGGADFAVAFYHLAQAKEWQMEEYAGMRRAFLTLLDQELAKSPEDHAATLRAEMERMRGLVREWEEKGKR